MGPMKYPATLKNKIQVTELIIFIQQKNIMAEVNCIFQESHLSFHWIKPKYLTWS